MKQKELKRLRRSDLLELLLELSRENDKLRKDNHDLKQQLNDRTVTIENSGSLAEAALQLNGVFEAAQKACDQYVQNIQSRSENIELYCRRKIEETQKKCDEMLAAAQQQAQHHRADQPADDTLKWLSDIMDGKELL